MAHWQRTLNIADVWQLAHAREITANQLAQVVADRLEKLEPFGDPNIDDRRDDLVEEFRCLGEVATFDDFDCVLEELYEWGDTSIDGKFGGKKVCWVARS